MIGQVSPNCWLVHGDPTDLAIDILDAPKGAIVIDIDNVVIYLKMTGYGDNSLFTTQSVVPIDYTITGLTGGGSTKLDGQATTTLTVARASKFLVLDGTLKVYLLVTRLQGDITASDVVPTDYHSSTNTKVWTQIA